MTFPDTKKHYVTLEWPQGLIVDCKMQKALKVVRACQKTNRFLVHWLKISCRNMECVNLELRSSMKKWHSNMRDWTRKKKAAGNG